MGKIDDKRLEILEAKISNKSKSNQLAKNLLLLDQATDFI